MRNAVIISAIVLTLMLAEVVALYLMLHWPYRIRGNNDAQ